MILFGNRIDIKAAAGGRRSLGRVMVRDRAGIGASQDEVSFRARRVYGKVSGEDDCSLDDLIGPKMHRINAIPTSRVIILDDFPNDRIIPSMDRPS